MQDYGRFAAELHDVQDYGRFAAELMCKIMVGLQQS